MNAYTHEIAAGHRMPRAGVVDPLAAMLEAEELRCIEATPQGAINCPRCQAFRTDVSNVRYHPCCNCQPLRSTTWRPSKETANDTPKVTADGRDLVDRLPPAGGSVV